MNYAYIVLGVVRNVIVCTPAYAALKGLTALPTGAGVNWTVDGENFQPPPALTE